LIKIKRQKIKKQAFADRQSFGDFFVFLTGIKISQNGY